MLSLSLMNTTCAVVWVNYWSLWTRGNISQFFVLWWGLYKENVPYFWQKRNVLWIFGMDTMCIQIWNIKHLVGFRVFTVVVIKSSVFWDITSCSTLKVSWRFRGTCHLHLQGQRLSHCFHSGISRSLFLDPEHGGVVFLWNVNWLSTDYTALYPRR
jgi:hypothetical protein